MWPGWPANAAALLVGSLTGKKSVPQKPGTSTPPFAIIVEHIMKSWNGHGDVPAAPQRAPAGNRFLTAIFVSLIIIAGLDTVVPSLKHRLIPEPSKQPQTGADDASKPFEWSQVRVEHSQASTMWGGRMDPLPRIYI